MATRGQAQDLTVSLDVLTKEDSKNSGLRAFNPQVERYRDGSRPSREVEVSWSFEKVLFNSY